MSKIRKNTKRKRNQFGGVKNRTKSIKKRKSPRKQMGSGKNRKNSKRRGRARYLTKFQGPMQSI